MINDALRNFRFALFVVVFFYFSKNKYFRRMQMTLVVGDCRSDGDGRWPLYASNTNCYEHIDPILLLGISVLCAMHHALKNTNIFGEK